MLVFVAYLVEFLIVQQAATSLFFILMLISLIDVIAGFFRRHHRGTPGRHLRTRGAALTAQDASLAADGRFRRPCRRP
ncbi:hypothetical protein QW131_22865 [Roseibium salinum]|nr:hypothetical protein [Roseibium salinum]